MLFLNILSFINIIENNYIINTDIINNLNNSKIKFYPIPISNTVSVDKIGIVDFRYNHRYPQVPAGTCGDGGGDGATWDSP